jgi:uncharacterized protein (TIGR00299 family) protein
MIAYFDCFSGISGDMTLGAFVDLGVPVDWLSETLKQNLLTDFDLKSSSVSKNGMAATQIEVIVKSDQQRDYATISEMIKKCDLPEQVKRKSLEIFEKLAAAESKIHNRRKEHIHFHEVGGVDAIVDIVGTCLCLHYLEIKKVIASPLPLGGGFVHCSHGKLPVPAPATAAILKNIPVYGTEIPFELVTPTGAAIIATIADEFSKLPDMKITKIGYGSGQRDLKETPNLLRIIAGDPVDLTDRITMVETSIDDMNPEVFGYLIECLLEDGALDAYLIPVYMKKNRPGTLLQVLCRQAEKEAVISRIFTETTTLGIRCYDIERRLLEREIVKINTAFGMISAKKVYMPDGSSKIIPEYDVCREIARKHDLPIQKVYEKIVQHPENSIK